ncbi:hypothetical protein [Hymenobacter jejuensis]|uniref:Uncharacterized protein n=1 Tax=Hymenobacter jejuensis TaxID=2502781 RepID=A0A5B8A0G5_9BACT|nr:hypothetical protein [Hymenobacter jejuensis]QDA60780.1 hypothetical protein FHG12_11995 [Hymenobacter jejuensis]
MLLLALALLTTCAEKIDFGPDAGITYRDAHNYPHGDDPTDWTSDGSWNKKEKALFSFATKIELNGSQLGGLTNMSFFPNPVAAGGAGQFHFDSKMTAIKAKLVFVDQQYKVIQNQEIAIDAPRLSFMQAFPPDKFSSGHVYRMYYAFYGADGTLYQKGHGDIKIDK